MFIFYSLMNAFAAMQDAVEPGQFYGTCKEAGSRMFSVVHLTQGMNKKTVIKGLIVEKL